MSEKLITDGTYALSVKEYTGELEPGQGIDITQNVISVTGKQDTLSFGYDENNRITTIDNHGIGGGGGSDETVLWEGSQNWSASPSITCNDSFTAFNTIKIYNAPHPDNRLYQCYEFIPYQNSYGSMACWGAAGTGGLRINSCQINFNDSTKVLSISYPRQSSIIGTSITSATCPTVIKKIVGINRKA